MNDPRLNARLGSLRAANGAGQWRIWRCMRGATALLLLAVMAPALRAADAPADGKALYRERCGMCHQTIGMAVGILARRPGDASKGFLEDRNDLSATFVRTAVRTGIANMPRMARGEVSDAELAAIAAYLAKGRP